MKSKTYRADGAGYVPAGVDMTIEIQPGGGLGLYFSTNDYSTPNECEHRFADLCGVTLRDVDAIRMLMNACHEYLVGVGEASLMGLLPNLQSIESRRVFAIQKIHAGEPEKARFALNEMARALLGMGVPGFDLEDSNQP